MADLITVQVPKTNLAVSYDPESYAGAPVWLHPAGQPWFVEPKAIGLLGAMVGHGQWARVGLVATQSWVNTMAEEWASWTWRAPREATAVRMAYEFLAREFTEINS